LFFSVMATLQHGATRQLCATCSAQLGPHQLQREFLAGASCRENSGALGALGNAALLIHLWGKIGGRQASPSLFFKP